MTTHTITRRLLVGALVLASCVHGEHREAREKYNEGVAALAKGEFEEAEKALLSARSDAGVDPELRFRAAYDLGEAYAAHADKVKAGKDADLAKALELEQQAANWFSDAQRLRATDADTTANLAIVRARVQSISDELRKSEGKLEARLDALIGEQRGVLEEARAAWLAVKQAGGSDPLAQQASLTHLADKERGIVAEAGVIGDLAADEIDAIGKKPEDKRSDDEKVRVVQLKNLDLYLLEARTRIADARRKLQELAAEDGVDKAESALVELKRAREQLLDPITVMRGVAQDQIALLQDTGRAVQDSPRSLAGSAATPEALPAWLEPAAIAARQGGLHDRIEEVRARLDATVAAPATPPAANQAAPDQDAKRAKLIERVKAALPAVGDASTAMDQARQSLAGKQVEQALEHEEVALEALARAIEQFSDLKQTIELAYAEQKQLVTLLSPEAAKQLKPAERAKQTRDGLARNLGRVVRLEGLLTDEVAALAQQEQQLAAQAADPKQAGDPKQAEAAKQQLAGAKDQLAHAEELRGQAQVALDQMTKALAANKDPTAPAKDAETKLEELRRLFFSVIEHLKELIRDQGETRDKTSATSGEDDFSRAPKLPGLIGSQEQHTAMAKAIVDALAKQADAAGKAPQDPQKPQQGPDAKTLSAAAEEVRAAGTDMTDARGTLVKARDATNASESLTPVVKSQAKAIEHLEAALELLEPPQKQQQKPDQQKQDQQKQDQQKQEPQKPEPQGGAGQRARDQDARQQREKRDKQSQSEPVDKDW